MIYSNDAQVSIHQKLCNIRNNESLLLRPDQFEMNHSLMMQFTGKFKFTACIGSYQYIDFQSSSVLATLILNNIEQNSLFTGKPHNHWISQLKLHLFLSNQNNLNVSGCIDSAIDTHSYQELL